MRDLSRRLMKSPRCGKKKLAGIMAGGFHPPCPKLTARYCNLTPLRGCPADILVDGLGHLLSRRMAHDLQAPTGARKKQTTQLYKAAYELLQLHSLNTLIVKVNLQGAASLSVVYKITSSPGTLWRLSVQFKVTCQTTVVKVE